MIGKDGKIVYADTRFNANAQDGYDKLAAAIKAAKANWATDEGHERRDRRAESSVRSSVVGADRAAPSLACRESSCCEAR